MLPFARIPCHSQAVERCVKMVTEASAAVCSISTREGLIKLRIKARQERPQLLKKSDYCA